jgi:hypothetical protein
LNKLIFQTVQSRRGFMPVFLLLGILVLGASACTMGGSPAATSAPVNQAATEPQAAAPDAALAAAQDVNSMNACELVPGEAVASALNAHLSEASNAGTGSGPSCTYGLVLNEGSSTQLYFINLVDPTLWDLGLTALVDPQPVSGLGDLAFSGTRVGTSTYEIQVRNVHGVTIDVVGDDAARVQMLAEYVVANLP